MSKKPPTPGTRAYAEWVGERLYFDQRPDPESPQVFDVITFRMPHGGLPRPQLRYVGRHSTFRLLRFICGYLRGHTDASRFPDRYLSKKLRRLHDAAAKDEKAYLDDQEGRDLEP